MKLKDTPVKYKLMRVIMITCTVVLLLMSCAYIIFEYINFRERARTNLSIFGAVIAANSSAALAFDSPRDAYEILNALQANKQIVSACLYDMHGNLFAKYPRNIKDDAFPKKPLSGTYTFRDNSLLGFEPVTQNQEQLGTLFINRNMNDLYVQLRSNALIALLMILVTLLVAWILSGYLQNSISQPIMALEKTAKRISRNHDYSVRAVKDGEDELGSLTDAFNLMLSQIESQNHQILKANEESSKLAAIVESSGDAIIGTSVDQVITSWNNSAERIFGYSANAMIDQPLSKLLSPELNIHMKAVLSGGPDGEQVDSFETRIITGTNELLDISLTISLVKNEKGNITGLSLIARDISVQKQNERLIKENEEHLRLATQAAEIGIFDMDLALNKMNWDKRSRELFGITTTGPLSFEDDFLPCLHDDDRDRVMDNLKQAYDLNTSKENYVVEYRCIGLDKKLRWIRAIGKVYFNQDGQAVRSIGILLDITQSKTEEIKKNDFVAIISHELKTPLTSLKSYVQLLLGRARKDKDEFRINALSRAELQSNKMASMIEDFLNLARIEEGKFRLIKQEFDLASLLSAVVEDALFISSTHAIHVNTPHNILVSADKDKIGQVLINLVSNAAKYSTAGSEITVSCEKLDGKVKISVSDQGIGISPEDQKRLFSRFYRVEHEKMKTVSGFGIGLYIVSEILKVHNSAIEVESTEGKGSTFSFALETLAC